MPSKVRIRPKPGEGRIVWILGAGFSKGLGGPLIADLFAPVSAARLTTTAGFEKLFDREMRLVHWLYNFGTGYARGRVEGAEDDGQHLWENAEEFLATIDQAARDGERSGRANFLRRVMRSYIPRFLRQSLGDLDTIQVASLRDRAVRFLVAECTQFLVDARPTEDEVWKPYYEWREKLLGPRDTVITFNYDLVPEQLGLMPLLPGDKPNPEGVQLLKLHGSLDWLRGDSSQPGPKMSRISGSPVDFVCSRPASHIGIATPGPSKHLHTQELKDLWEQARLALQGADAIVILGYSFPKTDSEARGWLADAIASNRQEYLALHVVLGPHRTETVDRVMELMQLVLRRGRRHQFDLEVEDEQHWQWLTGTVRRSPLYAEDLFSAADRLWLCLPYLKRSSEA